FSLLIAMLIHPLYSSSHHLFHFFFFFLLPPPPLSPLFPYTTLFRSNIYRSIKSEPAYPNMSNPQIADAAGTLQTLNFDHAYQPQFGSTWSAGAWASQAMQTFGGRVQDSAMGVQQIVPPLPDLFGSPTNPDVLAHQLIEMPQGGDSPALASAKMYSQAGLRIVNDGTSTKAYDQTGNNVPLPPGAVTQKSFYDA